VTIKTLAILVAFTSISFAGPKFATYPKARNLCNEHVTGNKMHIVWASYATSDSVAKVVAHYEKTLKAKAKTGTKGERKFVDGDHHMAIYPASKNDDFPACNTKPKAVEATVILMSRAIR
jgi:hypothetical protein